MEKKVGIIILSAILCTLFIIPLSMGRENPQPISLEQTSTREIAGLSYPYIAKTPPINQFSPETWDLDEFYQTWLNSSSLIVYDPSQYDIIIYVANALNASNILIAYLNANNSWAIVPYSITIVGWSNQTYMIV